MIQILHFFINEKFGNTSRTKLLRAGELLVKLAYFLGIIITKIETKRIAMIDLEEIQSYIINDLRMNGRITESRIKRLYDIIPDKDMRINDDDKKFVACVTENYENSTVYKAIKKLIKEDIRKNVLDSTIRDAVKDTCVRFRNLQINDKPRIPFYILVLNKVFSN